MAPHDPIPEAPFAPALSSKYDTGVTGSQSFWSSGSSESSFETVGSSDMSMLSTFGSHTTAEEEEEEYHMFNRIMDSMCSCVNDVGAGGNVCRTEVDTRAKPSLLYRSNQGRHSTKTQKRNNAANTFLKQFTSAHNFRMPNSPKEEDRSCKGASPLQRINSIVSRKPRKKKTGKRPDEEGSKKPNTGGKKMHRRRKKKERGSSTTKKDPAPHAFEMVAESSRADESTKPEERRHGQRRKSQSTQEDTLSPIPPNAKTPRTSPATKTPVSPSPPVHDADPETNSTAASSPAPSPRQIAAGESTAARSASPLKKSRFSPTSNQTAAFPAPASTKSPRSGPVRFPKKTPKSPRSKFAAVSSTLPTPQPEAHASPPTSPHKKSFWVKAPQMTTSRRGRRSPAKSPRVTAAASRK